MQKRNSKQRKERPGKGTGEFRIVTILDEVIERKKINKKSEPTKTKHELLTKISRPLFFF